MTVLRSSACVPPDLAAGAAIYLYWPEEESLVLSL